ncbi:SGNH/GDSL hydrolase family protein [Specibacter sp. NPDC057265]|uniref:SGNH/GDSL hydrolase family protein n=1 Tax=Specibacter sp. NPDC057265 TaxID=3346075 RepID=UPI003641C455
MAKRVIRLKEYRPGSDQMCVPTPEYLARTDGTLGSGPFRCRTDLNGFIETGNSLMPDPRQVIFLGDSFVESVYSPEQDRFISVAERELIKAGHSVQFRNGGYSGSTTLQLINVILNKVYPLTGPGGTIVFFGPHSDRDYLYKQGSYWSNTPRGATILPPGEAGHVDIPRGMASAESVLKLLVSTTRHLGLHLVFATTPYREGDYETDPIFKQNYHEREDWFRRGMVRRRQWIALLKQTALDYAIPLIDVQQIVNGQSKYFYDELHLSPAGHQVVAGHLVENLTSVLHV